MIPIYLVVAFFSFFCFLVGIPILFGLLRFFGFFTIVDERQSQVFVLFGDVIGVIDEPGIHFLWPRFGWRMLILNIFGKQYTIDLRLDQSYQRSLPVNSEEGAPVGIGIWYEMFITDPVSFLFKNTDPRGSLAANVSNSVVRCLSNMPLAEMLMNRHAMSDTVRNEVSPLSDEWGYKLGSVYIRKVHFRDIGMIKEIESKVVNRLRQVTSAIKQDGANQVSIIASTAERQAAIEFAKAAAIRPALVGAALKEISKDTEVTKAMFDILEVQRIVEAKAKTVILPAGNETLKNFVVAERAM